MSKQAPSPERSTMRRSQSSWSGSVGKSSRSTTWACRPSAKASALRIAPPRPGPARCADRVDEAITELRRLDLAVPDSFPVPVRILRLPPDSVPPNLHPRQCAR